jgi:hypothetical protein
VSRERWLDEALEASDRALFRRRARALPPASVPELAAILAAADARPRRNPRMPARVGVVVALSLVAAASVLGVAATSALATHERGARAILADEGDASVLPGVAWTSYEPAAICEPGAEDPGGGETCAAVPASLVVASSDGIPRACVEPQEPVRHADDFTLACKREPEMSSP